MAQHGFAVAAFRDADAWRIEPLPPAVLSDLGVLLQALRSQSPEGGPFVIACVDDEFFLVARMDGGRIALLLSGWVSPNLLGEAFVLAQAIVVAVLAELEYFGSRLAPVMA